MDMAKVQQFFFKAMVEGWATNTPKIKVADMPGYKAIYFKDGNYSLMDRYCVTPLSNKSAGTTTIWFNDIPVWVMNYGGYYEEEVIDFLKRMLGKTYQASEFIGGRGPWTYVQEDFAYRTHIR